MKKMNYDKTVGQIVAIVSLFKIPLGHFVAYHFLKSNLISHLRHTSCDVWVKL